MKTRGTGGHESRHEVIVIDGERTTDPREEETKVDEARCDARWIDVVLSISPNASVSAVDGEGRITASTVENSL